MTTLTPLATDELAEHIAHDYLHSYCQHAIVDRLGNVLVSGITEAFRHKEGDEDAEQGEQDKEEEAVRPHSELFEALFKAIAPYEKKFADFLRGIWEQERKIIIANLKKMKKAWLRKDTIDNILYPQGPFVRKITDGTKTLYEQIMETESTRLIDVHEFDIAFDVTNPETQKWLKNYTVGFGKALEGVNHEKLRRQLIKGMAKGESIPELMNRINTTYANWSKYRSENIARTETLLASNKGAIETYRQSGVVKSKIWLTFFDLRTCPFCESLDGQTISLEENWFDVGDKLTVGENTMKMDYRDVGEPPLHAMCRCTVAASFEEVSRRVDFHKNLTGAEKRSIGEWTTGDYIHMRRYLRGSALDRKKLLRELGKDKFNDIKNDVERVAGLFKKYKDGASTKTIYRGLAEVDEKIYNSLKSLKPGETIKIDSTVTSWSESKSVVESYSSGYRNVRYYLKGGRSTTGELDISKYSAWQTEKEVIINNTDFKLIKTRETIKGKWKTLHVYLEEIG